MKKRVATKHWLITGILFVLTVGLIGIYGYKSSRPTAAFDFLSGATYIQLVWAEAAEPRENVDGNGNAYTLYDDFYALPRDFATIRPQVERELIAKGFKFAGSESWHRYSRWKSASDLWGDAVELEKDVRYRSATVPGVIPIVSEKAPSWTGVRVILAVRQSPVQSFVTRCRQWISEHTGSKMSGYLRR